VVRLLLDQALAAHGGLDRWSRVATIRARLDMYGPTWDGLGQPSLLTGLDVAVELAGQRTVFTGFTGPGRRGVYTPDRVSVEDRDGTVVQERSAPAESFPARSADLRWDPLHALYFAGYGLWNYLTTPYLLTRPGFRTEELPPDGDRCRRLRVTFPSDIITHCAEQTFHFDESGLQRRLDYAPRVLGDRAVAHRTDEHRTVSGLVFPTRRRVFLIQDGRVTTESIINLDLADITVEFAGGRG
jgi:hypothetical protein